jgi:hypothetical protein
MRKIFISIFAVSLISSCNSSTETKSTSSDSSANRSDSSANNNAMTTTNNSLSDLEKSEGWVLLFDGNSKAGWHIYNNKSDGAAWNLDDGAIHLQPMEKADWQTKSGGDIVSDQDFDNFDLKLEWKIDTGGNSGIMIYVKEDVKYEYSYYTGPEMQVLDNARHPDSKIIKHRAGDLYDLISGAPETVNPALEWNQVEIISNKGALEFHLNGTKILNTTLWDDNWKKMLKASKFKQWPDFGTFKSGKIALQDHGAQVWYRNIKIKKL